ncbi:MAG: hypothetical protein WC524_04710 [Candidatus Aminicenantales bacterium]|nr:hypothetical protein [Acidobacteriota bacterium]
MKKKLFLFVTFDGVTFSSDELDEPDVDNLQVLGYGEGLDEDEAFKDFLAQNQWVLEKRFEEAICVEIKNRIYKRKVFSLKD